MNKPASLTLFLMSELHTYCYLVARGKPAAYIAVKQQHVEEAAQLIASEGLRSYIEPLNDEWVTLWIYRYPHILEVIKASPNEPQSVYDDWILGKLFGYSEEAIGEFAGKDYHAQ